MATSIDNLINVAFRKGEDLSRFGLKVGGKGDYRPPQFDAESLKFEYIDANESYGIDLNGSRFLQKLSFAESQDFTRATTGTFIGSNGLIQTAAIDAPRFTHDPVTREVQGLLIEEQRTNHWTQNTDLTGAGGVGSVTLAPSLEFGAFSFRLEAMTAGQGIYIHEYGVPYSEGTRKGVYVKAGELSVIDLSVYGGSTTTIRFYLLTQQVDLLGSGSRVINPMIEDFGGGWFRISIEGGSDPNGAYTRFRIFGLDDDGGTANIQIGDGFYLALPQIEEATFSPLSSPIITNGTQVTRAADSCVRVLGDEFNPDEGSVYWEGEVLGASYYSGLFSIATDNDNRLVDINIDGNTRSIQFSTRLNGDYIVPNEALISSPVGVNRVCVSYSKDRILGYANGVKMVDVSNFGGVLPPATDLGVGKRPWAAAYAASKTEAAAYIPKFLTEAELSALTGAN